jgi:hypothetical protein
LEDDRATQLVTVHETFRSLDIGKAGYFISGQERRSDENGKASCQDILPSTPSLGKVPKMTVASMSAALVPDYADTA